MAGDLGRSEQGSMREAEMSSRGENKFFYACCQDYFPEPPKWHVCGYLKEKSMKEARMVREGKLRLGEVGYFVKVPDELIELLKWTYHDPLVLMVGTGGCLVVEKEVEVSDAKDV